MEGPGGGNPGAFISSKQAGGGNGQGGDILILVGGVTLDTSADPAIGVCGAPEGDALIAAGATITSDAASGRAGDIALHAGRNITVHGTVRAEGFEGAGHGGAITLDACCDLFIGDTGLVRSAGRDPGPDRVHVEGCVVTIFGVVESTGPAHEDPEPNCTSPERPGKPANSTACVEIWSGTTILIDSTNGHFGQVNADTGMSGGSEGHGWIDILANGNITINDGTNDDHVQLIGGGPGVPVIYIVHANQYLGTGNGGDIVVMSKAGSVSTFGNAIQASDFANGGDGGSITIEAGGPGSPAGDVALDAASIQASGDVHPNSFGGVIDVRSFNGDITGAPPGSLTATGGVGNAGDITLIWCITTLNHYSGGSTPAAVNNPGFCGGMPTLPEPAITLLPAANCLELCTPVTPTPTPTVTNTPTTPTVTPTPDIICNKATLASALAARFPLNGGYDDVVRTYLGETVQDGVDTASDVNGDGFIIVGVLANANGNLGGHVNQSLEISQVYPKPFGLAACSVTLHDPTPGDGIPTARITAGAGSPLHMGAALWIMDLHAADSSVAGWKVEGDLRYMRNVAVSANPGVGMWLLGNNNTMHNGVASGNGLGILVQGDGNIVTDADAFSSTSHGVGVFGNSNQLLKIDAGDIGKGNGGHGFNVSGNFNVLTENKARSNTLDGIRIVAGTGNRLKKNLSGGTASQNNGDCEFEVVAGNINDKENKANNVLIPGGPNAPFPTGCIGSP
jgi:hypothetical protein